MGSGGNALSRAGRSVWLGSSRRCELGAWCGMYGTTYAPQAGLLRGMPEAFHFQCKNPPQLVIIVTSFGTFQLVRSDGMER
jgi:hypothetical protein